MGKIGKQAKLMMKLFSKPFQVSKIHISPSTPGQPLRPPSQARYPRTLLDVAARPLAKSEEMGNPRNLAYNALWSNLKNGTSKASSARLAPRGVVWLFRDGTRLYGYEASEDRTRISF